MTASLLDTSAIVAPPDALPGPVAISAVTLGELHAGVVLAPTPELRAARLGLLAGVEQQMAVLDVDRAVAREFGRLRGISSSRAVADLLIAATALVHDLVLITRDERQAALLGPRAELLPTKPGGS